MDEDILIEQIRSRLQRINESASAFTKALGLPPEAKDKVISRMALGERGVPLMDTTPSPRAASDDVTKQHIYETTVGFLSARLRDELPRFHTLWQALKPRSLEVLQQDPRQRQTSGAMAFADASQSTLAITSVVSWVIASAQQGDEKTVDDIAREAQSRGCSRALSYSLARYLSDHL